MEKVVHVHTKLEIGDGVLLDADDLLELSLDCFVYRRCHRTVSLRAGREEAVCTPTNHPFPGALLSKDVHVTGSEALIDYRINFWFAPFEDIKRGGLAVSQRSREKALASSLGLQPHRERLGSVFVVFDDQ